jgi:hypothetical protein
MMTEREILIALGVLAVIIYIKLFEIGRTLNRIEIWLQEAAREADRVIRQTSYRHPPPKDMP